MKSQAFLDRKRRERTQRDDERADELRRVARDVSTPIPLAVFAPLAFELCPLLLGDSAQAVAP